MVYHQNQTEQEETSLVSTEYFTMGVAMRQNSGKVLLTTIINYCISNLHFQLIEII